MSFKLLLLILMLTIISGCIAKEKEVNNMEKISISSEAFNDGGTIPDEYTCEGEDISPPLSWQGLPDGTKSIALIMDDPDASGRAFVHWVIYNIPGSTQKLSKGIPRKEKLADGSLQGMTDFGKAGYGGPCPPLGKPHRYFFKIYAIDKILDLPSKASKEDVETAMKGHILAQGELIGKYAR
ncbi:MAG: YbhB/YbcL family Raf kinase inhibitor-like protein [Candidatus Methanoperedens sp.]|nr:YbhB/YbcL family Raf kinase inhibitor-like protein [Candidatus Methanoperedens sp.]